MNRVHAMELVRAFRQGQLTRRVFLQRTATALGSMTAANMLLTACAASPEPPSSDPVIQGEQPEEPEQRTADGLVMGRVEYSSNEGEMLSGYLARPDDGEARPAVVVIQEWWGLNEHIKDITRRFAREGFVALAPDLYHGVVVSEPDEARKLLMELDMPAAVSEIREAVDFLQAQEYVGPHQVGVIGFCMGGGLALQTALKEEDPGAVVAFYGRPLSPGQTTGVKAPILGLYGEEDRSIPVSEVRAMQSALDEAGIENEIHIYEGAGHAFFNDTRESYEPDVAEDAWQRALSWFQEKLGK